MVDDGAFHHKALDAFRLQIRLVNLVPHKAGLNPSNDSPHGTADTIKMSISVWSLEEAPPYTALSYTWGPPESSRKISVDGKVFRIRENLWQFWRTFDTMKWDHAPESVQRPTAYFWVDQLCIDQENTAEKSTQVKAMGQIFRRAKLVISWLGPEGPDSCITQRALKAREDFLRVKGPSVHGIQFPASEMCERRIKEFLDRSYWSRLWIIQELFQSQFHFYMCGDWIVHSRDLWPITESHTFSDWSRSFWLPVGDAIDGINKHFAREMKSLPELIIRFYYWGNWECQEVHDKVYGLLGLAEEQICVDYTKPLEVLAMEVLDMAKPLMAKTPSLSVISVRQLVEALEKTLKVDLHSCGAVPKLWAAAMRDMSNAQREAILEDAAWGPEDEWKAMKLELVAQLNS